jgi:hypothetical protein
MKDGKAVENPAWLKYNNKKNAWLKNYPYGYAKWHLADANRTEVGDYYYDRYLSKYYDFHFAEKPLEKCVAEELGWEKPFFKDIISRAEPISFNDFRHARKKMIEEHERKIKESKLRRIQNSKEELTIAEKFLVYRTHINKAYAVENGADALRTPKELRANLTRLRASKRYPELKKLDRKLRAGVNLLSFKQYEDDGKGITWEEMRMIQHAVCAVHKLVVAENDIEGLSDEQIENLALLETL